jgi:hypothetical protein
MNMQGSHGSHNITIWEVEFGELMQEIAGASTTE